MHEFTIKDDRYGAGVGAIEKRDQCQGGAAGK